MKRILLEELPVSDRMRFRSIPEASEDVIKALKVKDPQIDVYWCTDDNTFAVFRYDKDLDFVADICHYPSYEFGIHVADNIHEFPETPKEFVQRRRALREAQRLKADADRRDTYSYLVRQDRRIWEDFWEASISNISLDDPYMQKKAWYPFVRSNSIRNKRS